MSAREAAENVASFVERNPSVGLVNTIEEKIRMFLCANGVSEGAEFDFDGPRRRVEHSLENIAEQLSLKYIGSSASAGFAMEFVDAVKCFFGSRL